MNGGYYSEIYDNPNYKYNGKESIVVSNIELNKDMEK